MKPPDHPTPSGDRRVARLLLEALERAGHRPFVASTLRTRDGAGDPAVQDRLFAEAQAEAARLIEALASDPPAGWLTYHCHYKAPDLIGPRVTAALGIPYAIAEASRARKRLTGPWARFAAASEAAIDAAGTVLVMSPPDREALARDRPPGQRLVDLPPFLDPGPPPEPRRRRTPLRGAPLRLLAAGMMRGGVKVESYRALSRALALLDVPFALSVAGDGPARAAVEAALPDHTRFFGSLDEGGMSAAYAEADLFVWPGIGEAYGMVYLEAQAAGLAVVAEAHPGPASVIAPSCALTPPGDAATYAAAIRTLDPARGMKAREWVIARHSLDAAAATLRESLPW